MAMCLWHGYVPMAWLCAHGMAMCLWHGYVPMAWLCAYGMAMCTWHGYVHMAWLCAQQYIMAACIAWLYGSVSDCLTKRGLPLIIWCPDRVLQ